MRERAKRASASELGTVYFMKSPKVSIHGLLLSMLGLSLPLFILL